MLTSYGAGSRAAGLGGSAAASLKETEVQIDQPFHAGELAAQRLAGESAIAQRNSAVIADSIMPGALAFIRQQPMVVLGTQSDDGAYWALPLVGEPGFVQPLDTQTLQFDLTRIGMPVPGHLLAAMSVGTAAAVLAIDLSTRRRLRINGTIIEATPKALSLAVKEAYPNCPKYIQRRALQWSEEPARQHLNDMEVGTVLGPAQSQLIQNSDTMFVASGNPERGMDVSHRGGNPGFIQQVADRILRIPDYAGNSLFNTIGNLLEDPRAGLAVMDFANGMGLLATGRATVEWNRTNQQDLDRSGGTGRFWTFAIDQWQLIPLPAAANWGEAEPSPFNPGFSLSSSTAIPSHNSSE